MLIFVSRRFGGCSSNSGLFEPGARSPQCSVGKNVSCSTLPKRTYDIYQNYRIFGKFSTDFYQKQKDSSQKAYIFYDKLRIGPVLSRFLRLSDFQYAEFPTNFLKVRSRTFQNKGFRSLSNVKTMLKYLTSRQGQYLIFLP